MQRLRPGLFVAMAVALGVEVALACPHANAAAGAFIWDSPGGQQFIPAPTENQCYPTHGATGAMNLSAGDAYLYTDDHCTIGKDAGNIPRFQQNPALGFESVVLRTSS